MSLSVVFKTPDGLVLASDSRLTITNGHNVQQLRFVDCAQKALALGSPNPAVALTFVGGATGGVRSVRSLLEEWRAAQTKRKTVEELAQELKGYLATADLQGSTLIVAGYDETAFYGRVFEVRVGESVSEAHASGHSGISLAGDSKLTELILNSYPPPLDLMPVGASAALAKWLIETTVQSQRLGLELPTVGGAAQVMTIERGRGAKLLSCI